MSTTRPTTVYTGSLLFKSYSKSTGLPIDQFNFVIAQATALLLGIVYRKIFSYEKTSSTTRHMFCLIPGAFLGYFCFGYQINHLLVLATLSYIGILACSPNVVQRVVMFVALMYLSYLHLLRIFNDYGGWTIDITGPIMIAIQKVTNVAFSLHDGLVHSSDTLNAEQKRYAIRKRPSLLEFYSYVFQFQTLLCGPLVFYNDYLEFVDGTNFTRHLESSTTRTSKPSPTFAVLKKLAVSIICAVLLLTVAPRFPILYLADDKFLNQSSFVYKIFYLLCATTVMRFKYYHAWILGECICNASGLGFNGFSTDSVANWDLMSNIEIWNFETSTNLRASLASWNKTTQVWLRRTAYERNTRFRILLTYVLSALWHGFYPGYYLTFLSGALFTLAARSVRRCIRPRFQTSKALIFIYDIVTCITTRIIMAYLVFPFVLLEFQASFNVYYRLYFFGHILGLAAIFLLPALFPPPPKPKPKES